MMLLSLRFQAFDTPQRHFHDACQLRSIRCQRFFARMLYAAIFLTTAFALRAARGDMPLIIFAFSTRWHMLRTDMALTAR